MALKVSVFRKRIAGVAAKASSAKSLVSRHPDVSLRWHLSILHIRAQQDVPRKQSYANHANRAYVHSSVLLASHSGTFAEITCLASQEAPRKRFNEIQASLDVLGTNFSNNIQDAGAAFKLHLSRPADVAGLPPSLLGLLAQQVLVDPWFKPGVRHIDTTPSRFVADPNSATKFCN